MNDFSRMESMLGTWTVSESFGSTNVFAVAHLMKSPTRGYACELDGCSLLDGNICSSTSCACCGQDKCVSMSNTTVHASDFAVFFSMGLAGFDTNGWIGPYSAVVTPIAENSTSYQLRYVRTDDAQYLHANMNATLFSGGSFDEVLGLTALQNTLNVQTNFSDYSLDDKIGSCDHGNAELLLPILQFDFTKHGRKEHMTPSMSYSILLSANKTKTLGLDTSAMTGPLCFHNQTNSSWVLPVSGFATKGCVDELPCVPPAATGIKQHVTITNPAKNFDVTNVTLTMLCFVLALLLVVSLVYNITAWKSQSPPSESRAPAAAATEEPVNPLEEPLLPPPSAEEAEQTTV